MLETTHHAFTDTIVPFLLPQAPVVGRAAPAPAALSVITVFAAPDEFTALQGMLAAQGFDCTAAPPGRHSLDAVLAEDPPIIIADMATPGFSGFDLVRDLRTGGYAGRIFALVECGDLLTSVIGLEMGADLVLDKPVQPRLLCSYLKKALQDGGSKSASGASTLRFGRLVIDMRGRQVSFGAERIELSAQDFELLALLARHAGRHIAREDVIEELGGSADLSLRSVDCKVYRLRKRLADHGVNAITTVRGRGYLFAPRS